MSLFKALVDAGIESSAHRRIALDGTAAAPGTRAATSATSATRP